MFSPGLWTIRRHDDDDDDVFVVVTKFVVFSEVLEKRKKQKENKTFPSPPLRFSMTYLNKHFYMLNQRDDNH